MISVQNHLQRLSGSNFTFLLLCIFLSACTTQKALKDGPGTANPNAAKVYNPQTGQYETIDDPLTLVDTVAWVENTTAVAPIGAATVAPSGKKDIYQIGILLPMNASTIDFDGRIDAKARRFLNYYSGVKMALADLEQVGISIEAKVYDTQESVPNIEDQLKALKKADAIIGPYKRECLAKAAEFADDNKIPVFSPWTPSFHIKEGSEYFIQVVPGLASHADAAMRYASEQYDTAKFFLVATPENQNDSRMTLYHDAYSKYNPGEEPIQKLVLDEAAVAPDSNDFTTIYVPDMLNVFVMPYYQRADEEFVSDFIRKVHAEHAETEVVVIGLPQWMNFRNLNPDYLEGLQTHITAVQFVDNTDKTVQEFNARFFTNYASIPEIAAWQGYQFMTYIGKSLYRYGSGFLTDIANEVDSDFLIRPVFEGQPRAERKNRIRYFENKRLDILLFVDQQFHRVE